MVYDLFAESTTDAYANSRRATRVLVDGQPLPHCFYADTEAGVAKAWTPTAGGAVLIDDAGSPVPREVRGVVVVEER